MPDNHESQTQRAGTSKFTHQKAGVERIKNVKSNSKIQEFTSGNKRHHRLHRWTKLWH
jgi:hypothetical protein